MSWVRTCRNELLELLRSLTQSAACCALGIICIARNNCSLFVATRHVRNSAFRNFVCIRSFSEVLGRDVTRLAYVKNTSATASARLTIFDTLVPADADRSILPYEARSTRRLKTDHTSLRVRLRSSLNLENTSPHPSTSRRFGCYQIL